MSRIGPSVSASSGFTRVAPAGDVVPAPGAGFAPSFVASPPRALLPVAPALAGASGFAVVEAGDGETGGTALLPVAADFTGCAGEAEDVELEVFAGSAAPLFGVAAGEPEADPPLPELVVQTVFGPDPPGFTDASLPVAAPDVVEDGFGIAF